LRSGTSIGAQIRETEHAQSTADFLYKMNIALKEANETEYWINLLKDTGFINQDELRNQSRLFRSTQTPNQYSQNNKKQFD